LWGYDSLADVEEKRRARDADPRWAEYLSKGEGLVARQNNKLCRPTDWSSVK
ncbi:MAG: NIPSNAP family protein, partial [Chloroflexi bacterium]|nr:NIPSNAP family protein [Chloroflexota bacterium]